MSGSYVQRRIDFTFTREQGVFTDGGTNTVTLSGLRTSVTVARAGAPSFNTMTAKIYGMTASSMADLSTLGMLVMQNKHNKVAIYAGDDESGMGLVFSGTIYNAWANFESMPQVSFDISGQTGLAESISPISPSSYKQADVSTIISALAGLMGRSFENNGVTGIVLANPYFQGNAPQQIQEAAAAAGIEVHDDGTTIAIWPKGGSRGGVIPLIGPTNGLVGYPKYTANGLDIVILYNPNIQFGGQVQLESSITQANGTWTVYGMVHNLEAQSNGGSWFTAIRLVTPGYFAKPG